MMVKPRGATREEAAFGLSSLSLPLPLLLPEELPVTVLPAVPPLESSLEEQVELAVVV
jgi:hypothetical protein